MVETFVVQNDFSPKKEGQEDNAFTIQVNIRDIPVKYVMMVADSWGSKKGQISNSKEIEAVIKDFFSGNIFNYITEKTQVTIEILKEILYKLFFLIEDELNKINKFNPSNDKGSTCTIALILKSPQEYTDILIGHAGNSRAYLISSKSIKLLTEDDNLVWQYYVQGKIKYKETTTHIDRHFLTQALGCNTLIKPQISLIQVKNDETLLLCSDGLYGALPERKIKKIVNKSKDLKAAGNKLLNTALKKKNKDNIAIAIFSNKKNGLGKNWKYLSIIASVILLVLILGKNTLLEKINEISNTLPNKPEKSAITNKNFLAKKKSDYVNAKDFNIQIPSSVAYNDKDNVEIKIEYLGDLPDKMFILKITGSKISGIDNLRFQKKLSTSIKIQDTGKNNLDILIKNNSNQEILRRQYTCIVRDIILIKPIFKLTMVTLRITNYNSIENNILSINWMEGANDKFQSPSDKHIYKSSKLIPSKIKIKYINQKVFDYGIK
jgi:PPM family protein phosphatase